MAFDGVGQEAGLTIWRIEDFTPVLYDKSQYGKFYVGDSYIVLNTRETGGNFTWDVHFWLGKETSQDEAGSAAMLAVQLDDVLGGAPVQHGENMDNESTLFLSYFKKGIKYLPGGIKSGFNHWDPESVEKRLFQVKGKRNVKVKQVPLDVSSMNKSDCFILDGGKDHAILVFMPKGSRKMEQFKAIQVANEIRDEDHAGNADVEIIDPFSDRGDVNKFFSELGSGSLDDVPEDGGDDVEAEAAASREVKLYRFHDGDSSLVATGKLRQDMLDSSDAYLLLAGGSLYVWVGKGSSKEERIAAMNATDKVLAENNMLVTNSKVSRLVEGTETAVFKQFFQVWNETDNPNVGLGRVYNLNSIAEWDISELHTDARKRLARSAGKAIGFMPDDGSGKRTVWRVEEMELVQVAEEADNFLFSGDSYVIRYDYDNGHIVYFWQGSKSSQDEKAASAIHAARIDNEELNGMAVQVRVTQGDEPRHFLKMFGGNMVVFSGGKGSGFKNVRERDEYDEDGTRLFRVRCAGPGNADCRAEQQEEVAGSLASDDVFILESPANTWIWAGRESSEEELSEAVRLAGLLVPEKEPITVKEGNEDDDFWLALGGKTAYNTGNNLDKPVLSARLFHVVILPSGSARAVEIADFQKEDLVEDDTMILDSGDELYVWVGSDSTLEERKVAQDLATSYLDKDPTDRNANNSVVITVKQGSEPVAFTSIFPTWES